MNCFLRCCSTERGYKLTSAPSILVLKILGRPQATRQCCKGSAIGSRGRARISSRQKAVFIDRDGTLNENHGYALRVRKHIAMFEGATDAIKELNEAAAAAEFRAVVITNQPVIARGECTFAEMNRIHARVQTELGRKGAFLDRIYYCPHHPERGFVGEVSTLKGPCECRKPKIGMIQKAREELNIDLKKSWLIGDSTTDLLTAQHAGLKSILVGNRRGRKKMENTELMLIFSSMI